MRSKNIILEKVQEKSIAVLAGGISTERDVSFRSANNVLRSLLSMGLNARILDVSDKNFTRELYDIAFNCMHGAWGEDGHIQGYLELKGIPYTGSPCLAAAISHNKPMFKALVQTLGISVPKAVNPLDRRHYPFIAKPRCGGSSIGIHIVQSPEAWAKLVGDNPIIQSPAYFYEAYVPGTEITCGIMYVDNQPYGLPILEIETNRMFYDYEGKYTPGESKLIVPARIRHSVAENVQSIGKTIANFFDCRGCVRIDMIICNDDPTVLEMNTVPGLTELSDIPAQVAADNRSFNDLMLIYLDSAFH